MLAGTNGSGKSSIFDAVTYALFGHHRGGSQNAGELINKESTGLVVEFDFHLDGKLFRIKRTLRRSQKGSQSSTQQVFLHDGVDFAAVPVPPVFKAGGRWNTYEIEARGPNVTVKLNGAVTVTMNNGKFAQGPFALQYGAGVQGATGGPIKWRKVQIRAL